MNQGVRFFILKRIAFAFILSFPLISNAQLSCPAFGRNSSSAKWEFLLNWNTVDAYSSTGKTDFYNSDLLLGGDYTDVSLSPGLTIKYYVDDITVLRLKMIYILRNEKDILDVADTTLLLTTHYENQFDQTYFKIAPGFQWTHLVDRFSFYGGFELPYTYIGDFTQSEYILDTSAVLNYRNETNGSRTTQGGYSIGLGVFAGTTFYYRTLLGIGLEFSDAYQYTKIGGDIVYQSETTGTNPSKSSTIIYNASTLWRFTPFQASIQLSFRF